MTARPATKAYAVPRKGSQRPGDLRLSLCAHDEISPNRPAPLSVQLHE